jgi:hypothetical protein
VTCCPCGSGREYKNVAFAVLAREMVCAHARVIHDLFNVVQIVMMS